MIIRDCIETKTLYNFPSMKSQEASKQKLKDPTDNKISAAAAAASIISLFSNQLS